MNTYSKFIKEFSVENTPFKGKSYNVYHSGSCQCSKDCDCISERGRFLGEIKNYTHPLSDKTFNSLKSCEESYKVKLTNHLKY